MDRIYYENKSYGLANWLQNSTELLSMVIRIIIILHYKLITTLGRTQPCSVNATVKKKYENNYSFEVKITLT